MYVYTHMYILPSVINDINNVQDKWCSFVSFFFATVLIRILFFFCIKYHNFFSLSFLLHLPVYLLSPSMSLSFLPQSLSLLSLYFFLFHTHTHTHTHTVRTMSTRSFNFIRKQQTILIILSANSELTVSLNCL